MAVTSKLNISKKLHSYSVQNYAWYPPQNTSMATFDILDNVKKGDVKKNLKNKLKIEVMLWTCVIKT